MRVQDLPWECQIPLRLAWSLVKALIWAIVLFFVSFAMAFEDVFDRRNQLGFWEIF